MSADAFPWVTGMKVSRLAVAVVALAGVQAMVVGCHKATGFAGTWKTTQSNQGGSVATMTFNSDQTMSFVAMNGPKQQPYKLTGMGTWSGKDNQLTVTPMTMDLEGLTPVNKAKMQPYLNAQINVAQTGPVVWKGNDEFVCTKNGIAQDFKRVK